MPSIQAAPAQTYPVGETSIPSAAGASFAQRTINNGSCSIAAPAFTDPNTAIEISIDFLRTDGTWWRTAIGFSQYGSVGGWLQEDGSHSTVLGCEGNWSPSMTIKGGRIRVLVRDVVKGSGLAQPVNLGAITLTWN